MGTLDEVDCPVGHLLVDGLHPLAGQRPGVLDLAVGGRLDHAARAELLLELGILRIVG